jgi:small multidrug resistance pump
MPYVFLVLAIVAEVAGTSQLKSTEGLTRMWPTVAGLAAYGVAFVLLSLAIHRGMQVSIGYALWSALGTTLIVIIGALFLHEPVTAVKILGIALVIAGVTVLNLGGSH